MMKWPKLPALPPGWIAPVRTIWLGMKCALLVFLVLMIYLAVAGFPAGTVRWIEQRLAEHGADVRIGHIYWHPVEGIIVDSARVYLLEADRVPAVEVGELVVRINPRRWLSGQHGVRQVLLRDVQLYLRLLRPLVDRDDSDVIPIGIQEALIHHQDAGWRLDNATLHMLGIELTARGRVETLADVRPTPAATDWQVAWREWQESPPEWLETLLQDVGNMRLDGESVAGMEFVWVAGQPEQNYLEARWSATDLVFRGLHFEDMFLHAEYEQEVGSVPLLQVYGAEGRAQVRGRWNRATDQAELYIHSDLLPVYWRNLLPDNVRRIMEQAQVNVLGATEVEASIGPSALSEFGQVVRSRIRAESVDAHGVWIEEIDTHLLRNQHLIHMFDLDALMGRGAGQGRARGQVTYDLDQHIYYGDVKAALDPQIVLPVAGYSRIASEIIQGIQIGDTVPSLDVSFSGNTMGRPTFHFDGAIRGTNFTYAGSRIVSFDSMFLVTNRVMRIDPLEVHRSEGSVKGWYQQDFDANLIDLHVDSSVDPRVLSRLAGGRVEEILRLLRFEGPVQVELEGRIDYRQHEQTDYRAHGQAERVGWRLLMADTCRLEWIAQGDQISLTNLVADLYGGTMEGHIQLADVGTEDPVRYSAQGELEELDFAELLRDLRQAETEMQHGTVAGRFEVAGLAEDDWRASLQGDGRIRIRDGQIFQIRLFGGLSDLLKRIYPRLGLAVQSDGVADFTIENRHVASSDIRFIGNIISLRGWGAYSLDDELDFTVHVQPLRRGFLVDAVRFVTYPVSRLLQFRLDGTLSEPSWRMDPLPRERSRHD